MSTMTRHPGVNTLLKLLTAEDRRHVVVCGDGEVAAGRELAGVDVVCRSSFHKGARSDPEVTSGYESVIVVGAGNAGEPPLDAVAARLHATGEVWWLTEKAPPIAPAGLREVTRFVVLPSLENPKHLVDCRAPAYRAFMLRAHGLGPVLPRNPRRWPRWFAVLCGIDKWRHRARLIWYRR